MAQPDRGKLPAGAEGAAGRPSRTKGQRGAAQEVRRGGVEVIIHIESRSIL